MGSTDEAAQMLVRAGNLMQPETIARIADELETAQQFIDVAGETYSRRWGIGVGHSAMTLQQHAAMLRQAYQEMLDEVAQLTAGGT